ncbi:GNAT family N-acetyltransferase [Paucibacter sp. B2R-40]|nr:GNAT family N-acetyltransferase [Paucibacter sp. B2R-40]MCV2353702.1 GNAT family N-acetyltransferase [Paucibacter sp. B2R-40]
MQAIRSAGLVLRAFEDSDAEGFAAAARESAASVGPWMSWCQPAFSEQDALHWFQLCRAGLASGTAHEFGIFSLATHEFLGGAGLNSINQQHLFCNLGYWVRQTAQRRGVALHTVQALLPYAFSQLGMQRVEIVVALGNMPSEGVARKCGAQLEGVARNRLQVGGVAVPASIFAVVPRSAPELELGLGR